MSRRSSYIPPTRETNTWYYHGTGQLPDIDTDDQVQIKRPEHQQKPPKGDAMRWMRWGYKPCIDEFIVDDCLTMYDALVKAGIPVKFEGSRVWTVPGVYDMVLLWNKSPKFAGMSLADFLRKMVTPETVKMYAFP